MKAITLLFTLGMIIAASTMLAQSTGPNDASQEATINNTEVRIVRLSQVRGNARIDRAVGEGFESAFANIPITQRTKLDTLDGSAEVEFEDNSTLRFTPGTLVEFTTLSSDSSGITNTLIEVVRGTVYADLQKSKDNTITLSSKTGIATLSPHSTTRLTVGSQQDGLAVFAGGAIFTSTGSKVLHVGSMKELLFDPSGIVSDRLILRLAPVSSDSWEQDEKAFHEQYSQSSALSGSPYLYGVTDLNYYGSFADIPGCGRVWRPYFVSATWDPYSSGVWAWYPSSGYSWVSPYPWGWAPFHYGAWQQCTSGVWGWAPGGSWRGLRNTAAASSLTVSGKLGPMVHTALEQPSSATKTNNKMLLVTTHATPISGVDPAAHAFIFRNDSAGLGVPRKTYGELGKLSIVAQQSGTATTPVYAVRMWTVRTVSNEQGGNGQPQRTAVTIWVPANDPRLLQAANDTKSADPKSKAVNGSDQSDIRASDRVKGSPSFQAAVLGADGSDAEAAAALAAARRRTSTANSADGNATPATTSRYPPGRPGIN